MSPSRGPATIQPALLPQSVEPDSTPAEAVHKRKRKVSFDGASSTAGSHRTPKERPAEPAAPSKTTTSAVKPPAKRQKKEVAKKKDPKQSEAIESPQASSVSNPAAEKSIPLEGGSEVRSHVVHGRLSSYSVPLPSVRWRRAHQRTPIHLRQYRRSRKDCRRMPALTGSLL